MSSLHYQNDAKTINLESDEHVCGILPLHVLAKPFDPSIGSGSLGSLKKFAPLYLSSPSCINGYQQHFVGRGAGWVGNPVMD